MDETLQTVEGDTSPNQKSFADDIEQFAVEPIYGMPTYEGDVSILHITAEGQRADVPIRARVLLGPDVPLPRRLPDGSYQQAENAFSALFNEAMVQLTNGDIGYSDSADPRMGSRTAFETMVGGYRQNPAIPISVIFAHGFSIGGFHFILREGKEADFTDVNQIIEAMDDGRLVYFHRVLPAIKERDGLAPSDPNLVVVLASCNASGKPIQHGATIISKSGIVGHGFRAHWTYTGLRSSNQRNTPCPQLRASISTLAGAWSVCIYLCNGSQLSVWPYI